MPITSNIPSKQVDILEGKPCATLDLPEGQLMSGFNSKFKLRHRIRRPNLPRVYGVAEIRQSDQHGSGTLYWAQAGKNSSDRHLFKETNLN
jgi:hypothetical protein